LDFADCPPSQKIISNQLDRKTYGKGKEELSDWLHGNAAGLTPEGNY